MFDKWCRSKKISKDFDRLRELSSVEEFERSVVPEGKSFIDDKRIETLREVSVWADEYSLTHSSSFGHKS